ncbi:hypothetical protein I9W82_003343 [Candida metapsilosis]|uniref:Uncharacterized protein n=1 Tax=Candida metapsilosis TaxID=273372 RepID=A0A8H7ZCZ9_9ASCO|nr:hypothetical protein I9W82_003343 [Candida metapsilosis]
MVQQSTRILLDLLPAEVLYQIVSNVGANNTTKILQDRQFLLNNKHLKHAIDYEIQKTSTYRFDNRVTRLSTLGSWDDHWRDATISDFMTLEEFKIFDDYCVEEKLKATSRISYNIKSILDYFELEELIAGLKAGKETRLALNLNFDYSGHIDGTELPNKLIYLKDRVVELSLDASYKFSFEIDVGTLENIEALRIGEDEFTGTLVDCHKLGNLSIRGASLLDMTKLPASLETLDLDYCSVDKPTVASDVATFPKVKNLFFKDFDIEDWDSIKNLFHYVISSKVENITFNSFNTEYGDDWFLGLLEDLADEHDLKLNSLSITGAMDTSYTVFPKHRLVLYNEGNYYSGYNRPSISAVPNTLTELTLHNCSFNIKELFRDRPTNLKSCSLRGCSLTFDGEDIDFSKFKYLTYLELGEVTIGNDISKIRLPDSLKFDKDLVRLKVTYSNLSTWNVVFESGSKLQYLCLNYCDLESINMCFPPLLKELNLARNNLSEIPLEVAYLKKLRILTLSENKIQSAKITFSHNSLEMLDLDRNRLSEIQLLFPKGVSNLKRVNLESNKLEDISMNDIGHNGETKHDNFYELSVLSNRNLTVEQITALVPCVPRSTRFLWGADPEKQRKNYLTGSA